MQIPKTAKLTKHDIAGLGGLVVGRYEPNKTNFMAISSALQIPGNPTRRFMTMLCGSGDSLPLPFIQEPAYGPIMVFDLGHNWYFDLDINQDAPQFTKTHQKSVLARVDTTFYLILEGGIYLNLSSGFLEENLNYVGNAVFWEDFKVMIPGANEGDEPTLFFHWQKMGAPANPQD